jgi:hypothetical protein
MNQDDDFDFPDRPAELSPLPRPVVAEDLHLGPAKVKPFGRSWVDEHGPQPPGISIHALDLLIAAMISVAVWEIITVWWWIITT